MILINTDLPDPERPGTTTFSPSNTSRSTPRNTLLSPNDLKSPRIRIICFLPENSVPFSISMDPDPVCNLYDNNFFNKNQEHGYDHRHVRRFTHPLRTLGGMIT